MELADASVAAALYFCKLCDKPFTKELQCKRHTAYCSRTQGRKRPRSCRACNQSKIKCNAGTPCQQCLRKKVDCSYDLPQSRRKRPHHDADSEKEVTAVVSDVSAAVVPEPTGSDLGAEASDIALGNHDLHDSFDQAQDFGLDEMINLSFMQYSPRHTEAGDMDVNETYHENSLSTTTATSFPSVDMDFASPHPNATGDMNRFIDLDFQINETFHNGGRKMQMPDFLQSSQVMETLSPSSALLGLLPSIPTRNILSPPPDKSLSRHFSKLSVKQQPFASMLIDTLFAYPRMTIRRETFPPFIHAHAPSGDSAGDRSKLPGPLVNCMGIAQLFTVCNDDTRLFLWVTIRAEMDRFKKQIGTWDKYEAFSAMQASLLYLIMRAVEETPQRPEDDFEMLMNYITVKTHAVELTSHLLKPKEATSSLSWSDWILAESSRRAGWVWFILTLVFHVSTGNRCWISQHFREFPLPCGKTEWEAQTESQWRTEHESAAVTRGTTSGLYTFGDLIEAHKRLPGGRGSEKLDIWNADIDKLGMALNLAVYMV